VIDKKFRKKKENFICDVCGKKVFGTGYTDHCPNCLFSKHVDIFPGDRKAGCGGLMKPLGITKKNGKWQILYRCQQCGHQKYNQVEEDDNQAKIVELSKNTLFYK